MLETQMKRAIVFDLQVCREPFFSFSFSSCWLDVVQSIAEFTKRRTIVFIDFSGHQNGLDMKLLLNGRQKHC